MIRIVIKWLRSPLLENVDVDSTELLEVHRRILENRPIMRGVFQEFYDRCRDLDARYLAGPGKCVELGAGVSFFKKAYPQVIATDIKPGLDMVVDAMSMPFEASSVRAFYAINCFHHLPSPARFFAELERTLAPGGGCILIEPYYGPLARVIFRRLFTTETFDRDQPDWDAAGPTGVMRGANQALSYIVFKRDRALFDRLHPALEVVHHSCLRNAMRYLLSGGLNFRPLVPTIATPLVRACEWLATPLCHVWALHHVVVLRKRIAA